MRVAPAEEAAGILKHRRRKEKAQRKLSGMQANLDRLTDLTEELGKQLKPLARQAEAAKRAAEGGGKGGSAFGGGAKQGGQPDLSDFDPSQLPPEMQKLLGGK